MESIDKILQERGNNYGDFVSFSVTCQNLKRCIRHGNTDSDQQEALEMIVHKIARIVNGNPHHIDSWRDIEGYAKLVADRLERLQTGPN